MIIQSNILSESYIPLVTTNMCSPPVTLRKPNILRLLHLHTLLETEPSVETDIEYGSNQFLSSQ